MAKKWSDVAASSAFQALSFDEQEEARRQYFEQVVAPRVPTEDLDLARNQFLTQTELRRPANDSAPAVDYTEAATSMLGAPPSPPDNRGLLQRVGDFFRPQYKSVLEGYQPTAQERQAEIDKRLSYGAGPISQETVRQADVVRSTRGTRDAQAPANRQVEKVVQKMDERGEQSFGDLIAIARKDEDLKRIEAELEAEGRQRFGKENPILGSIAAGSAGLISGFANIPSVAADAFNQVAVNPVLRALGLNELPRAPTAFGTEYLTKAASDYMPKIGKQDMDVAIKRDEFAPWLMSKLAANSPQIAQSLAAAFVPPLRAVLLPGMAGTAAGQSYVEGDDSRVAVAKGLVEYASEKLPLGVFDKVGDVLKGMSPVKANTVLAVAGQRALQAGGAITANTLTNAIEETAAQLGGNVLDKYFQGKDIELTKGLAEAALIGGVTGTALSTPQAAAAATGYYDPNKQIAREIDAAGRAFDQVGEAGSQAVAIDMLRTEPGTSNLISPAATVTNFTPPDSATKQAGLVDIEVPVPNTPPALPEINTSTEQQFGLDRLRMGGANVGTAGTPGGLAAGSGQLGGGIDAGGLAATGRGALDAAGLPTGTAGGLRADDQSALPTGGEAGQPAAGVAPVKIWAGRAGDGYATEGDAQQALPGLQRKNPTLDWSLQQNADGKFIWSGFPKETTLGTQTDQALQGQAQGLEAQAPGAAAAQAGSAAAPLELSDSERAGLKLALPAPAPTFAAVQEQLAKRRGVTVEAVPVAELNDSQRVASTVARLLGNTLTVVRATSGDTTAVPNGFINRLGGKHIFVDSKADDAPVSIALHEGLHSLPAERRKALNTALLEVFNQDQKGEFLREFGYTADKFDEEAPAMMAQAISKRQDFWEELRDKMGNREFGEVAKVILTKLNQVITGAKDQYGDAFVNKYIKDVVKARDLLTTAYAESMQAQGFKPDTALVGEVMASNRAEQKNAAASRIEDVSADRFKRTPALQQALADLQEGKITRAEYSKVVDEARPVYPYKELPEITTEDRARFALANGRGQSAEKAAKYGLPAKELTQGEMVQLRLDIPSYQEHDAWVVTVHRPKTTNRSVQAAYDAGPTVGYESVASITNATFGMRQSSALKIAQGTSKGTIATVLGEWKPITPAEAKVKAQAAMKSPEWTQVGMDPFRHSYFYDRDSMRPVVAADEVIQVGPLVLAKNAKFDDEADVTGAPLMFSEKGREPEIGAKLRERIESDYDGAAQEYAALKGTKGGRLLDADIARELSPEYRADRSRAPEVHEAVSDFIQRTFETRMSQPGEGDIVAFMAGGGGAGKSSAEELLSPILDQASTVMDGTLSNYEKAERNVSMVLNSGRQARVIYVYREPVDALVNGVLTRAKRTGRVVPIDALIKGHAGSSSVVRKLQEKFGDNPNFKLYAVDNSRGAGEASLVNLDDITPVILDGLKERLINATEQQYQAGQIGDKLYRATTGKQADAGAAAQGEAGGGEVRSGAGGRAQQEGQFGGSEDQVGQQSGAVSFEDNPDVVPPQQIDSGGIQFSLRRGADRVGDFDVRTMRDGTIVVYGDSAAIRSQIPDDVKGRVTKEGIVFTNAAAPRVKAALEGRKTAYSRGGQVVEKLPMKDGKYLGAPEKYNTPAKIAGLRKSLRKLTLEGERGRYWYENSSREVLAMVGGNVQEARKFVALLAIYSPQAKVDANSTFALRAWAQYKAGQPISVKTGVMDAKAQAALDDVDAFWSGEKTGNFFFNLLREIDPSTAGKQGATIDMWMMRAGEYATDAPTATQYAFMENETNRLAQELGWEPQQVQAAIWVAMKARMENSGVKKRTEASSEKNGWIRFDYPLKNGKPVKTRVILNAQKHRDNWLKHAFQHVPSKADTEQAKFDFSDGVRRHIGQISWEARPGRSTGVLPGVNDAPYEQQVEFQQAVQKALLDDDGVDLLAYKLGLLVDGPDILAPGIWQGEVAAGMQKQVVMAPAKGPAGKTSLDPAQKKALDAYAATLGLLLRQEGVGYHRPFYKGTMSGANGVDINVGRSLTPQEAQALWGAIDQRMTKAGVANWEDGAGMISSPTGIRVVNFGALPENKKFHNLVEEAASTLAIDELEMVLFSSDGDLITNDWKSNPNGQSYQQRISAAGSPDLLGWARSVLAPRVQAVFDEFSSRYGWGDPGTIEFSNRPDATGGGRDRAGAQEEVRGQVTPSYGTPRDGAVSAVGYHYSRQSRASLTSSAYGTGLRGAEISRLEGADPRLKQRIYFYIDRGTGINPEAGVGGFAHKVDLRNLYDMDADPLRLARDSAGANAFEVAVLDAGFDGYMVRDAGPSGNAVLLGRHAVPVQQLGSAARMQTADVVPAAQRELNDAEMIAANKMLPAGQVSGKRWAELISRGMPDVYARLADSPVWQSDKLMYRSELARELQSEGVELSNKAAAPELDKEVVSLFKDLQGSRGLGRIRVQERVDAHPMAETIRQIDKDFMDILERLDDAGLVKINCK